jgi:DNA-binding LytR/AlgR family response regulator
MRVVIIEDEPPASEKLCEFIERFDREIEIIARLETVEESFAWFGENRSPDLVFSDVVHLRNLNTKLVSSTNRTPNLRKWLENL